MEIRTARDRLDRVVSFAARMPRFWLPAAVVATLGLCASVAFALVRPRVFRSETLILYRETIRSADFGGSDTVDPARKLGMKLKEMVLSRTRLQKIIDEFKLYHQIVAVRGYVDAVDEMRNRIAFRVKDGDTFGLSFEGENPKMVQEVTARLAEELIAENSKHRVEQAEVTREFLDEERQRVEAELKEKETDLARFLARHPEFARETTATPGSGIRAAQQTPKPASPAKVSDPALLALEREASRLQARLGVPVTRAAKKDEATAPRSDPKLLAAKNEAEADLRAAQKNLDEKLAQFTEAHPDVKNARSRLQAAEARVQRAIAALASDETSAPSDSPEPAPGPSDEGTIDRATLESQLAKVNDEIATRRKKIRESEPEPAAGAGGGAAWIVALETEWARLNRELTAAREHNGQLQDKQFKAAIAESAVASGRNAQMVVVDPAYRPTHPAPPGRMTLIALGMLISIGMALLVALGLVLVDDRLYDDADLESIRVAPLLGVVPRPEKSHG
jgi:uncharacterized protein involved in exopolysaccharide biosynthesis